ncbi:MAG: transketolase [Kiritimatiellia bacterium]
MSTKLSHKELLLTANTIRGLAMDGVQSANSGHPGMPMGMADVATVLWLQYLKHDPADPAWPDRDRFVLSGGHGSMLIYSLLHLAGYALPIEELGRFRQWESMTPGHPEVGDTPGVETTTGPLGQGCGNAVGMAIAEQMLAARFNTEEHPIVDHYTYVFCGDGDLMEGISHEVFSSAGHLGLNKLILFYDDNSITIEGRTHLAYSDDVSRRFKGYNWNVLQVDAHNFDDIDKAIRKARRQSERPTIIICTSIIGKGSPNKADTSSVHGEPLGPDEVILSKRELGLPEDQKFFVADSVRELFAARCARLQRKHAKWNKLFTAYTEAYPEKAESWSNGLNDVLPADLADRLPVFDVSTPQATRAAGGTVMQAIAAAVPHFVGGSADLAPSTKTLLKDTTSIRKGDFAGRNFHFGVREHGMGAIMNGVALHGGFRIFGATFFVFVDYMRPAVRLASIMKLPVTYVFTHDSFYVGEDGPTHEPVEQLASLRCMPGVTTIRPADPTETAAAWLAALENKSGPTAILLTRQNLNVIDRSVYPSALELRKGAYILWQSEGLEPDVTLIASGSEVELALGAAKQLASECCVRVVSMPSWELFEKQDAAYKASVISRQCPIRLVIEAAATMGWEKYVGDGAHYIGMPRFGASAPCQKLAEEFGFTVDNVVHTVHAIRNK